MHFGNELRCVRRVYVLNSSYKVGWVVDRDMERCMICLDRFNWLKFKHHCRACGSLVCSSCSPFTAYLPNFEEEDGSRVCRNCFGLKQATSNIVERSPSRMSISGSNASSPLGGLTSPLNPNDTMSSKAAGINAKSNTFTTSNPAVTARPSRKAMLSRNGRLLLYDIEENPEEMLERQTEEYIREFESKQLPLNKLAYE